MMGGVIAPSCDHKTFFSLIMTVYLTKKDRK